MMSPDSSQSSSDSQAAWAKLNSGGKKYTPLLICRGANGFGFSLTDDSPVGVCQVEAGSSAEKAGLQENDRIVEVEKEDVINTSTQQLAAIIRHQQKTMEVVVWREVSTQRVQRTGSQQTDRQTPCKTPVKRSGSKLSGLGSARKKYKQQCKERKAKGRRDGVADGATVSEKKALKMVAYLHEIEGEFCDTVERSRCYYVSQLQQSGQLDEDSMATLFQNIDMLISMSRYFASKLEIVVRQADKKMIATAPEIYLPRIEVLKQNYLKYVEGVEKAEGVRLLLAEGLSVPSPEQDDILLLDELIYSPLHHIQKVAAAFSLFLQSVGDKDPSLPHVQRISSELRECCELIESYSQVSQPQFHSPAKSKSGPLDPEVAEIEERLEFPPHVKEFTLCEPNRHKIYWSEVKVIGVKHKLVAYLFSDIILVARQRGWRDSKLSVAMDPVNLCDIIDVDYGAEGSDGVFEIKLHYMSMPDQELCTLTMVCLDLETKLVWKGLLRDRLVRHTPPTEHSLSDQV
ncbi:PsGEF [Bugula neritina]|uniref:PsGEF n=1 Tax=Bugula neritina TaxID=10212 RepID=A0A7J7J999_BUGNE|nr:PsGEF [Bugula neritina]